MGRYHWRKINEHLKNQCKDQGNINMMKHGAVDDWSGDGDTLIRIVETVDGGYIFIRAYKQILAIIFKEYS